MMMKFEGRVQDDNSTHELDKRDAAALISRRGSPSASQKEALSDILGQIQNLGLWNEALHDLHDLTRFMRARNWDVAAALHMWTQMIAWRQQHGADDILTHFDFVERPAFLKVYTTGLHKTDRQGRPILIQQLGRVNLTAIGTITTDERMCLWHIQEYERLFRVIFPACSRHQGLHIDQLFTIIDLEGVSFTDMIRVRKLLTMFMKMDSDNYPETLAVMAIINAPYWFGRMWAAIKEFLQGDTVKKIQILSSDYQPFLLEHIAPENLLACYGGTSHGSITHNLGPWDHPPPHPPLLRQQQSHEPSSPPHSAVHQLATTAHTQASSAAQQPTLDAHDRDDSDDHTRSSHSPQHTRPYHLPPATPHHSLPNHTSPSTREPSSLLDFDRRYIQASPVKDSDPLQSSPSRTAGQHQQRHTNGLHMKGSSRCSQQSHSPPHSPSFPPLTRNPSSPTPSLPNGTSPRHPHVSGHSPRHPHNPDTGHSSPFSSDSSSTSYEDPQGQSPTLRVSITSGQSDDAFFSPCSTMSRSISGMGSPSSTHRSLFCSSPYSHYTATASQPHGWHQASNSRTQPASAVSALTASLSLPAPVPRKSSTNFPTCRPTSATLCQPARHESITISSSIHPAVPRLISAVSSPSPSKQRSGRHDADGVLGAESADVDASQHHTNRGHSPHPAQTSRTSFAGGESIPLSSRYAASFNGSVAGSVGFWSAASSPSRRSSVDSVRGSAAAVAVHHQRGFHMAVVAAGHALANGGAANGGKEFPPEAGNYATAATAAFKAEIALKGEALGGLFLAPLVGVSKHRRGPASMDANDAIAAAEAACAAADVLHGTTNSHLTPPFTSHAGAAGETPSLVHGSRNASMGQRMLSFSNLLASTAEHSTELISTALAQTHVFQGLSIKPQQEGTHTLYSGTPVASTVRTMPASSHGHSRSDSITQRLGQGARQINDSQQEFVDEDTDEDGEDDEAHLLTSGSPPLAAASSSVKAWYLSLPGASWFRHRVQSSRHRHVDKRTYPQKHVPARDSSSSVGAVRAEGSSSGGEWNGDGSGGERGHRRSYNNALKGSSEDITRSLLPPSGPSLSGMTHPSSEGQSTVRVSDTAVAMVGLSGLHGSGGSGRIAVEAVAELVTGLVVGAGEAFKTHARAVGRRARQSRARKRRQQEKQRGLGSSLGSFSSLCCGGQGCSIM